MDRYAVMVVEDEPTAAAHIISMLRKYFPAFQVTHTVPNGQEALALLEISQPDLLITDICMPVMSGLELVREIHARFPQLCMVVVSGYRDFEYARTALQNDVLDYILKPLSPATLRQTMLRVQQRLHRQRDLQRVDILRSFIGNQLVTDTVVLTRHFPSPDYWAGIVRWGGLPQRLWAGSSTELFPGDDEGLILYGRDELEGLCLYPVEKGSQETFLKRMADIVDVPAQSYHTIVYAPRPLCPAEIPNTARQLYKALFRSVTVGQNSVIPLEDCLHMEKSLSIDEATRHIQLHLQKGDTSRVCAQVERQILDWCEYPYTQNTVEHAIKKLFHWLAQTDGISFDEEIGLVVEDAFFFAATPADVAGYLRDFLARALPTKTAASYKIDSATYFAQIEEHITQHLNMPLTLQSISADFGVSQTYFCKLFRKYTGLSFNEYMTKARVEKAKALLLAHPATLVKDVATMVGYENPFYFSRIFRSITGVPPTEYMNQAMNNPN